MSDSKKITGVKMSEGEGAKVNRLFPNENYKGHHDPFVLMDEFSVEAPAEFPEHEHRGFEAITYMLEGSFIHEDNLGNKAEVKQGGIQAFNAGKSIIHSEKPGSEKYSHGIQLWVNLPEEKKHSEPAYYQLEKTKFIKKTENVQIKEILGENTSINLNNELKYLDIDIKNDQEFSYSLDQNKTGILYLITGGLEEGEENIKPGEGLLLSKGANFKVKIVENKAHFLIITGKPHNQPIIINGSFVE